MHSKIADAKFDLRSEVGLVLLAGMHSNLVVGMLSNLVVLHDSLFIVHSLPDQQRSRKSRRAKRARNLDLLTPLSPQTLNTSTIKKGKERLHPPSWNLDTNRRLHH